MLSINRVMLTGRLTRDPETKYLPSGTAVTSLSLAVNRRYQDKSGEWRDDTSFIDVEVWGKAAERIAENGRKGQPVYVEGRLKQDTWERDGQKQSKVKVSADTVKAFDVPQRGQQGAESGADYEDSYQPSPAPQSRPQPQQAQGFGGGSSSGSASDGLHFDGGSNVNDDVPF